MESTDSKNKDTIESKFEKIEHGVEEKMGDEIKLLSHDELYKNASQLMLSNLAMAVTGFLFWLMAAKLYAAEEVGLATVLISTMTLFALFSTSGINQTFIRFIPSMSHRRRNELVSASFLLSILISVTLSFIFVAFIRFWSPKLVAIMTPMNATIFILSTSASCVFILLSGMFIARKRSSMVFARTSVMGTLKVLFLPFLVLAGGLGVFFSHSVALLISIVAFIILLIRAYPRLRFTPNIKTLRSKFDFLSANYVSVIFLQLPNLLFPIIVLNLVSKSATAHFYMPWHIFFTFFEFIILINSAFLMEGAYEKSIWKDEKKTMKLSFLVAIGGIILFFVFGEFILSLFGEGYANSASLLYVLALSLIPASINQVYLTAKDIRKEILGFAEMNIFIYSSCLVLGTLMIPRYGIMGVGYGWLMGQMFGVILIGWNIFRGRMLKGERKGKSKT